MTDSFPPEVNASATRTDEHAQESTKGKDIKATVITCNPNVRVDEFSNNSVSLQLSSNLTVNWRVVGGRVSPHSYNCFPVFGLKIQSEFIKSKLIDDKLNFSSISW